MYAPARQIVLATALATASGCAGRAPSTPNGASSPPAAPTASAPMTTFADDLAFLRAHGPVHVLEAEDGGRVAVSPRYQARVMTSAVAEDGRSFGWIHRDFIASGKTGTPFDNYGGEDRLWLGPEGGQYGLYFAPGAAFTFDAWQVPHAMQEGEWKTTEASPSRAAFSTTMKVTNWSGTTFDVEIARAISLVDAKARLGPLPEGVRAVAFESRNELVNASKAKWTRASGLLSLWILAMYAPAPDGRVIIPFETRAPEGTRVVNDAYFGEVPKDRLHVDAERGFLLFVVDGKHRSKIGLGPRRAKNVAGSYSPSSALLTIVEYEPGPDPSKPYVDSMWKKQEAPYGGDVVNSYNDGPTGPGKPPLGGFYELETSSPGAELAPGERIVHVHRTFHVEGPRPALSAIAKRVLGVSLEEVGP